MKTKSTAKVSLEKTKRPITAGLVLMGVATAALVWAKLPRPVAISTVTVNHQPAANLPDVVTAVPERKPLTYYSSGISNSLFDSPDTPAVKHLGPAVTKKTPVKTPEPAIIPTEEPDPSKDYVYSAWVEHDGVITALIENSKTRNGTYVSVGDKFDEFGEVTAISEESVTVKSVSKTYTFGRPKDYSLIPLTANASYLRKEASVAGGLPGQTTQTPQAAVAGAEGQMSMQFNRTVQPGQTTGDDAQGSTDTRGGRFRGGPGFRGGQGFPGGGPGFGPGGPGGPGGFGPGPQ